MSSPSDSNHAKHLDRISAVNQPDVEAFLTIKMSQQRSPQTLRNYAKALADLDNTVSEPWALVSPTALAHYFNSLNAKGYAHSSQVLQRSLCKAFFRWLLVDEQRSGRFWEVFQLTHVKPRRKNKALTREQVALILQTARSPRNRVIISLLADSGFRRGEVCALDVASVTFEGPGAFLDLPDDAPPGYLKTGPREIYVVDCADDLRLWLKVHPRRDDPSAPLFPSGNGHGADGSRRLSPNGLSQMVRRIGEDAGIPKVHPHRFRHTRATRAAESNWSEAKMKAFFGWAPRSRMAGHYSHIEARHLREQVLADAGHHPDGFPGPTGPAGERPAASPHAVDMILDLLAERLAGETANHTASRVRNITPTKQRPPNDDGHWSR